MQRKGGVKMKWMKRALQFMVKRKKLFAVYMAAVAVFGGALIYYFVKPSFDATLVCLATAVPVSGLSSVYAWLGKEHVEIAYRNEKSAEWLAYRLRNIWHGMGIVCAWAVLAFLWMYLQYKSGNIRV